MSSIPSPAQPSGSGRRRHSLLIAAAAVAALVLVGAGITVGLLLGGDDPDDRSASPQVAHSNGVDSEPTAALPDSAEEPADTTAPDPLGVGYGQRDLDCAPDQFIVVLTSTEGPNPHATVKQALDRFPGAENRWYLDPASSCQNLSSLTNKVNLSQVPYMGPYGTAEDACRARMAYADTTTYVIGVDSNAIEATYCACSFDEADLPELNSVQDAEPTGDNRFWTLELQYMLHDGGYNPQRLVGGNFGSQTTEMVRSLQTSTDLPMTGAMDAETWSALKALVCS